MRAILRVKAMLAAMALAFAPAVVFAQAAPSPTTNTPATDAIGPAELQNFSLKGTVTRPADVTTAPTPARPQAAPVRPPSVTGSTAQLTRPAERTAPPASPPSVAAVAARVAGQVNSAPIPHAVTPISTAPAAQAPILAPAPAASLPAIDAAPQSDPLAPFRQLPVWPWIAAALALVAGGGFLLWRRWPRTALADGPQFDLRRERLPEPEPAPLLRAPAPQPAVPAPAPAPQPRPAPAPIGIVASRLRPALELGFHPLRCQVDDHQVAIEFELELFNSGTAPARAILAEASLINASATQDDALAAFYAQPNGVGDRLDIIPPMKRVSFKSQVVAPRESVQEYQLAGRKTFVPVIAFNALYEWSGGRAQSSAAYLVGRDTQRDKLGPLRLDQGAREYRELGARPLPSAVRT